MGSHSFLQEIFQTQRLNQCLLHCRQTLHYLSHQRSLKSRYQHGHAPLKALGGRLLLLPASGGSWHYFAWGYITLISASIFMQPFPLVCLKFPSSFSCKGTSHIGLGPTLMTSLNLIVSVRTVFIYRPILKYWGSDSSTWVLWGTIHCVIGPMKQGQWPLGRWSTWCLVAARWVFVREDYSCELGIGGLFSFSSVR